MIGAAEGALLCSATGCGVCVAAGEDCHQLRGGAISWKVRTTRAVVPHGSSLYEGEFSLSPKLPLRHLAAQLETWLPRHNGHEISSEHLMLLVDGGASWPLRCCEQQLTIADIMPTVGAVSASAALTLCGGLAGGKPPAKKAKVTMTPPLAAVPIAAPVPAVAVPIVLSLRINFTPRPRTFQRPLNGSIQDSCEARA
eukprot:TRINITY_DN3005_c0_g1_i3.p2 TRINITY_DN3005_c0_g1~~TRINITY_DN3005_c0_g1_i3.p2  ORF type:complete len:197 (+),score=26.32 TRINITY_DN3005_c0_g1_i3:288-878(+)